MIASAEIETQRLRELYEKMDCEYSTTAESVGFSCKDCDGAKCCAVDLIVHTYVERFFIQEGLARLDESARAEILKRSKAVVRAKRINPAGDEYRNSVCVLNFDGLCALYEFRPMICRLAGIAHVIRRPDGSEVTGDGCPRFMERIAPKWPTKRIDRTSHYNQLAAIEIELIRPHVTRAEPMTVAEIARDFLSE